MRSVPAGEFVMGKFIWKYNRYMKFNPKIHHRRSIRLKGYDYSQAGAYFVTIVAWQREMLFGEIVNAEMKLNEFGEIISEKWQWLETQYEYVELGEWIIMPNHLHGILVIHDGRGGSRSAHAGDSRIARYAAHQNQTIGWIDWRVQNGFDKTYQFFARHGRSDRLAAQLLRTHHPQRTILSNHLRIYYKQSGKMERG